MSKEYEYVIVGSGVAGSSVAKRLLEKNRGTSILILEAGPVVKAKDRRHWWDYVVNANGNEYKAYDFTTDQKGESKSVTKTDTLFYVEGSRVMLYGGSTVHWGGWSLRYKPEDFKLHYNTGGRLGGGDWPFEYEDLVPFYNEAEEHLSVCGDETEPWNADRSDVPYPRPAFRWTAADGEMIKAWRKNGIQEGKMPMARYRKCMTTGTCKYCPIGARFSGQLVMDELLEDTRHTGLEFRGNAPATEVLVDPGDKEHITGVRYLDTLTGDQKIIEAGTVILCNGAYESPKLLMQSQSSLWEDGIGNDHDQLGRYLVSHSILKVRGEQKPNLENWIQEYDFPTLMSRTYDTEAYQDKNKIFLFKNRKLPNFDYGQAMIEGKTREDIDILRTASREQELQAFMEEIGQKDNRLQLMRGKNRFGLPKTKFYFDRTKEAQRNANVWLDKMEKVILDMGYKVNRKRTDPPGGHHATGTCRMGTKAENSVTDSDMMVHGTSNLYVCSNAAFPTGAAVNPTLTLTAMAFRLAKHLAENK